MIIHVLTNCAVVKPRYTPQSRPGAIVTDEQSEKEVKSVRGHELCLLQAETPPEMPYSHRASGFIALKFLSSLFQSWDALQG